MGATVNTRIQCKRDTCANWATALGMIPLQGEIIIYTDYKTMEKEIDGEIRTVNIPGVKIGDGTTYVQDLPFIDEDLRDKVMMHIDNPNIHVTLQEKIFWNNKLNVDDNAELVDGALIFNRN